MDDPLSILFILGIPALLVVAGIVLRWLAEKEGSAEMALQAGRPGPSAGIRGGGNLPETRKGPAIPKIPVAGWAISPERYPNIGEGLVAVADHYRLKEISIASLDGLLVASSGADAEEDAAVYSQIFMKGEQPGDPKTRLLPLQHGALRLLCILKSEEELDEVGLKDITDNISKILKHWL